MTIMGQINVRSRVGILCGQPTRKLSLQGAAASFKEGKETVRVSNLSRTGMLLETSAPLSVGEPLQLLLPGGDSCAATVVWANETIFACEFEKALSIAALGSIRLHSPREAGADRKAPPLPEEHVPEERIPEESLGERIGRLRRERGFGMVHFAGCIGVSKPTLWKWEKGTVLPRKNMIQAIADVLGVSEKELLYGSEREVGQSTPSAAPFFASAKKEIAAKKAELARIIGVTPCRIRILIEA